MSLTQSEFLDFYNQYASESNMSIVNFCRKNNLDYSSFRRRYYSEKNKNRKALSPVSIKPISFIEEPLSTTANTHSISITNVKGISISSNNLKFEELAGLINLVLR